MLNCCCSWSNLEEHGDMFKGRGIQFGSKILDEWKRMLGINMITITYVACLDYFISPNTYVCIDFLNYSLFEWPLLQNHPNADKFELTQWSN